jgi:hypothetical protein
MNYSTNLMEIVKTYDGTTAERRSCRFIKGCYYVKNKQCFFIDGQWYRIDSGKIIFDYESREWIIIGSKDLTKGIVGFDKDEFLFGSFSKNVNKNIYLYSPSIGFQLTLDEQILSERTEFREGLNGVYYNEKDIKSLPKEFTTKLRPRREDYYTFGYNYGSDILIPTFRKRFNDNFKGDPLKSDAYKYISGFTFGVEFETDRGAIPEKYLINNGLIACRDGSISGFEYTTIPLEGETGIQCIKKVCDLITKYCSCSVNESMHVHIGMYPKTVRTIASLYRLSIILQREIYSMFPYYYADTSQFKRKGYCNPMYRAGEFASNPREIFEEIFYYLSNGSTFKTFPTSNHPLDRSGQHKWEISPRYHWLNFIPIIWGTRGTVEFRCHTPTLSATKTIYWLFILIAILKYAKSHVKELTTVKQAELPKITLTSILNSVYPRKISRILIKYMEDRKAHYKSKQDPTGELEIKEESKRIIPKDLIF